MKKHQIRVSRAAEKQLKKIPPKDQEKIVKSIINLGDFPYPHGYKKLLKREGFRIRVGNYRIIYEIKKKEVVITIIAVGHRKEIYE